MVHSEIRKHIEALRDENAPAHRDAIWALGKIGKAAVPSLVEALKDEHLRKAAIGALGGIGPDAKAAAGTQRNAQRRERKHT